MGCALMGIPSKRDANLPARRIKPQMTIIGSDSRVDRQHRFHAVCGVLLLPDERVGAE
jgi:hypothetical protein